MIIRGRHDCPICSGSGIDPALDPNALRIGVKATGTLIGHLCGCAHVEVGPVIQPPHGCDAPGCENLGVINFRDVPGGPYVYACNGHFDAMWRRRPTTIG